MAESFKELRAEVGAELKTQLGKGFSVFPAPTALDDIQKPTLVLVRQSVTKTEAAPNALRTNALSLWLILPQHSTEDALDDALEDVLEALDLSTDFYAWSSAERDVWSDSLPAYRITFTAYTHRKN